MSFTAYYFWNVSSVHHPGFSNILFQIWEQRTVTCYIWLIWVIWISLTQNCTKSTMSWNPVFISCLLLKYNVLPLVASLINTNWPAVVRFKVYFGSTCWLNNMVFCRQDTLLKRDGDAEWRRCGTEGQLHVPQWPQSWRSDRNTNQLIMFPPPQVKLSWEK